MHVSLHRRFEKRVKKLPRPIQEAYKRRRDLFLDNSYHPLLNNHSVEKTFPGCRSFNVTGDYRVVFKELDVHAVIFLDIGTHSELYR